MALFDQEFFPTPKPLIEKMLAPYMEEGVLPEMTVLEPSAGKGDIVEYVEEHMHGDTWHRRKDDGLYCIEQNLELQAILRDKGFAVIGDDFLRFAGEKAQLKLRMPLAGRKNFAGIIGGVNYGILQLDVDGSQVAIELSNVDKARLVPIF